jgi:hypothetical protein
MCKHTALNTSACSLQNELFTQHFSLLLCMCGAGKVGICAHARVFEIYPVRTTECESWSLCHSFGVGKT